MMPKFRGNSDDWLDDEKPKDQKPHARIKAEKPEYLDPEKANATVAELFPKQCRVRLDGEEKKEIACSYRRAAVLARTLGLEHRERSPVVVGDRVVVSINSPQSGVVEGICPRRNQLTRLSPSRGENVIQVIVANVDLVMILASIEQPRFSPGLVDRYLVATHAAEIASLLCVSKMDLRNPEDDLSALDPYRALDLDVWLTSCIRHEGIEDLKAKLVGKTVVFCGQSGVGKTTLLRELLQKNLGKISPISQVTGRGVHTTTNAILLDGPSGSRWIDTPGVREFGLHGIDPGKLSPPYRKMFDAMNAKEQT